MSALSQKFQRWMQRVPGPEAQPIVLPQRRVYVLPTGAGLAMMGTLIVLLLASINYNLSLGYAFTFLLGGAGLAHVLQAWRALVKLSLTVLPPVEECFAGSPAIFRLQAAHDTTRERPALCVLASDGELLTRFDLPPASTLDLPLPVPALRRGLLPVGRLCIECRAPLGWVRAWSYIEPDATALILPTPQGQPLPPRVADGGDATASARAGSEDFQGLRDYQITDAPSRIAWKSLARGTLLTKHYTGGSSLHWLLDFHTQPASLDAEARLSQLTLWVLAARQLGAATLLHLPGKTIGPGQDAAHHAACLKALALYGDQPT